MVPQQRIHRLIRDAYAAGARLTVEHDVLRCDGTEAACRPLMVVDDETMAALRAYLNRPSADERWLAIRSAAPGPSLIEGVNW